MKFLPRCDRCGEIRSPIFRSHIGIYSPHAPKPWPFGQKEIAYLHDRCYLAIVEGR